MASTIPTQERIIDPFASYNSNVVNKITEIVTHNNEGMLTVNSLEVEQDSTSPNSVVVVQPGYAIKDNVLINITHSHTVDFDDTDQYISSPLPVTGGNYYVVLEYQYLKQRSAPQASIKILQPTERSLINGTSVYLLLKVVKRSAVSPHNIVSLHNYDPEAGYETNQRKYMKYFASGEVNLPSYNQTNDQGRIAYESESDTFYLGYTSSWRKITTSLTGQISSWTLDATSGDYYYDIDTSELGNNAYLSSWFNNSTGYQVSPSNVQVMDSGDTLRVYFSTNTLTIDYIVSR